MTKHKLITIAWLPALRMTALKLAAPCLAALCLATCTKAPQGEGYATDPSAILPPSEQPGETPFTATLAARSAGRIWPLNAQLCLQYEQLDGTRTTTRATIESVAADGSAQLSAVLTAAKPGSALTLIYPAGLANDAGDDIDPAKLQEQPGTLDDITARFDAATATLTLPTRAATDLVLHDRVSISRFTPALGGEPIDGITRLSVSDGTHSYAAIPARGSFGTDGIYLAMLPVNDQPLSCTATTPTDTYHFLSERLTLEVGATYDQLSLAICEPTLIPGPLPDESPEIIPATPETPALEVPATETPAPGEPAPEVPAPTVTPAPEAPRTILHFVATIAPKGLPQTRSVDDSGHTAWVKDEQIAICYPTGSGVAKALATVTSVDDEGRATVEADLTNPVSGTAYFTYPASLANERGDDIDIDRLLSRQHGTISDISARFDATTGEGTLIPDGNSLKTSGNVKMNHRVLIGKFTPRLGSTPIDGITELTISDGTYSYTVTPESPDTAFGTGGIYVAMLPVNKKPMTITADTAGKVYYYSSGSNTITLEVGKLYNNLAIPMIDIHSRTGYGNGLPIN